MALFQTPDIDDTDQKVLAEIDQMRSSLASRLRAPARWEGGLRRSIQAKAVKGSNSIEGYDVSEADAVAAVMDDAPLDADVRTWKEITAYQQMMTYILRVGAVPGFAITEQAIQALLLGALVSEGGKRGLSMGRIAELSSANPAARFGLGTKGALAVGRDADFAVVDDDHPWTIRAEDSKSSQEYTPFEGFELTAKVTETYLRGEQVFADGEVVGSPKGAYLRRPTRA